VLRFLITQQLTGFNTCDGPWYYNYWGYYWGGFWRTPIIITGPWDIGWSGCSSLRAVLAFSFIAALCYLLSSFLVRPRYTKECVFSWLTTDGLQGVYVVVNYREEKKKRISQQGY
jgi:hypothetical protein